MTAHQNSYTNNPFINMYSIAQFALIDLPRTSGALSNMAGFVFIFVLLSVLCVSSNAELVKLTDEDFETQVASRDWIIKFHAPWCKHCKTLKPIFEDLALKKSHAGIGEIDATANKITAAKYNVTSFPTILYKQDGVLGKYDGARTLHSLAQFVDRLNAPAYMEIKHLDEIREHSAFSDNVTFLLAYNGRRTDADFVASRDTLIQKFKSVSTKLKQHASFAIMEATDEAEVRKYGALFVGKVEPGRLSIPLQSPSAASVQALEAFVESNNYPLVSRFDNHNFKRLSHISGKYIVAAVVDYTQTAETAAILAALEHAVSPSTLAAPEDQAKFIFGHLDGVKWRTFIKHHRTMVPSILVLDQANDLHQTFPLILTAADVQEPVASDLKAAVASVVLSIVHNDSADRWKGGEVPTIIEKMIYRFNSYYPGSLLVILLPIAFTVMTLFTPYPQEKKIKKM